MTTPLTNSYVSNVPQANQQINNTQQPIQNNFGDISDLIGVNHVNFNTADTFGKHNVVDYFSLNSDPTTASGEMALYSKFVANDPNISELFYRYPNNGNVVQLTGDSSSNGTTGSGGGQYAGNGYQYLASGLLMMWGLTPSTFPTSSGSQTQLYDFLTTQPGGCPGFSQTPFHMEFNPQYPGSVSGGITPPYGYIYVNPISPTQFNLNYVSIPYGDVPNEYFNFAILWMAIGV